MRKNISWRKEHGVDRILENKPEEILGCSMEALTEVFPHWQLGTDKTGRSGLYCIVLYCMCVVSAVVRHPNRAALFLRPVLYKKYGKFDATLIKKLTGGSFDNVIKYHIWEQEVCATLCTDQVGKEHPR